MPTINLTMNASHSVLLLSQEKSGNFKCLKEYQGNSLIFEVNVGILLIHGMKRIITHVRSVVLYTNSICIYSCFIVTVF